MEQEQDKSESVEALKRGSGEPVTELDLLKTRCGMQDALVTHIRGHLLRGEAYVNHLLHEIRLGMPIIHQEPLPESLADDFERIPPGPDLDSSRTSVSIPSTSIPSTPSPQIVAIEPVENCETELFARLRQYPPLMAQLYEAMQTKRWLIVMACKAKDNTPDDLLHSHTMKDFPVDEVVTVLQDHCRQILAEESRRIQALDGRAANKQRWR